MDEVPKKKRIPLAKFRRENVTVSFFNQNAEFLISLWGPHAGVSVLRDKKNKKRTKKESINIRLRKLSCSPKSLPYWPQGLIRNAKNVLAARKYSPGVMNAVIAKAVNQAIDQVPQWARTEINAWRSEDAGIVSRHLYLLGEEGFKRLRGNRLTFVTLIHLSLKRKAKSARGFWKEFAAMRWAKAIKKHLGHWGQEVQRDARRCLRIANWLGANKRPINDGTERRPSRPDSYYQPRTNRRPLNYSEYSSAATILINRMSDSLWGARFYWKTQDRTAPISDVLNSIPQSFQRAIVEVNQNSPYVHQLVRLPKLKQVISIRVDQEVQLRLLKMLAPWHTTTIPKGNFYYQSWERICQHNPLWIPFKWSNIKGMILGDMVVINIEETWSAYKKGHSQQWPYGSISNALQSWTEEWMSQVGPIAVIQHVTSHPDFSKMSDRKLRRLKLCDQRFPSTLNSSSALQGYTPELFP